MKRPFEINPCFLEMTVPAASAAYSISPSDLFNKIAFMLRQKIEPAFRTMPAAATPQPLITFRKLEDLLIRMNLKYDWLDKSSKKECIGSYPQSAPEQHDPHHFAQYALVWEPINNADHTRAQRTLGLEVGAGHYMASAVFVPTSERSDSGMALDRLTLHYAHQTYKLDVGQQSSPHKNVSLCNQAHGLLTAMANTIYLIHEDYVEAEYTFSELCHTVRQSLEDRSANLAKSEI